MFDLEESLINGVLESPRDSLHRLVYAEFLERLHSHDGDTIAMARCEFVRAGCALEDPTLSPAERSQLARRQRELQSSYGARWAGQLVRIAANWSFNRGFIHSIDIRLDVYATHAVAIHSEHPIEHLNLLFSESPNPAAGRLIASLPQLLHVRSLGLKGAGLGSEGLSDLVASPHLENLERLNLAENRLGEKGVRALLKSQVFPNLRWIDLGGNDLGPGCLREIASHLGAANDAGEIIHLETLELGGNPLTRAGARIIQGCRPLARVARW